MAVTASSQIKAFQNLSGESLTKEKAEELIATMLQSSWLKRFQVFSDQAVLLIELNTHKYLYASPSVKNIMGFEPEEFTDFHFIATLLAPKELEILVQVSNAFVSRIMELKLRPDETSKLHSARNTWLKKKDGTMMNLMQHGFTVMVNERGNPLAQMLILSDITAYNNKLEHFYSLTMMHDDGTEDILLSGRVENTDSLISPREQEILTLLSRGHSSRDIAGHLDISTETVKTHRKHLLEKTNSKNSIDLVRYGYAHEWL